MTQRNNLLILAESIEAVNFEGMRGSQVGAREAKLGFLEMLHERSLELSPEDMGDFVRYVALLSRNLAEIGRRGHA